MQHSNPRTSIKLIGLTLLLLGCLVYHGTSTFGPEQNAEDWSSSAVIKKTPRLPIDYGKITPTDQSPKKDLNILLNDPTMNEKWGFLMTDTKEAWSVTKGNKDIVVAIIDTGADTHHADLLGSCWVNKGEAGLDGKGRNKANNGIDDDGDGYIDDVCGWNFVDNNNNVADSHGHGTHIAGIIAANDHSGRGFNGIAPNVSLMILKYYDPKDAASSLKNTVKAIDFAVNHGANIINYSGGGLEPSPAEKQALERAQKKGILVVAAAGNERSNSDIRAYYPADYGLPNIISVTAINKTKSILPSSNYGVKSVDLAAPGNDIFSTLPNGKYGYLTGTSQATAFVTGVAALVMSNNRDFNAQDVIKYLTRTGDIEDQLDGKTRYKRRLNSFRALTTLDQGVGVTGVVANNTAGMNAERFATKEESERTPAETRNMSEPLGQLTQLGQVLQKRLNPGVTGFDFTQSEN